MCSIEIHPVIRYRKFISLSKLEGLFGHNDNRVKSLCNRPGGSSMYRTDSNRLSTVQVWDQIQGLVFYCEQSCFDKLSCPLVVGG